MRLLRLAAESLQACSFTKTTKTAVQAETKAAKAEGKAETKTEKTAAKTATKTSVAAKKESKESEKAESKKEERKELKKEDSEKKPRDGRTKTGDPVNHDKKGPNGETIYSGPKGGNYYLDKKENKVYIK